MIGKRWFGGSLGICLAGCALGAPAEARAEDLIDTSEAQAYGVASFGHAGECESDQSLTHAVHTATASAFRNQFTRLKNFGLWSENTLLLDKSVKWSNWRDSGKDKGADTTANAGADEPDVIYIHTHGVHTAPIGSYPGRSDIVMGKGGEASCRATTDNDIVLGNGDLEIAVIKACQSGDYDVWKAGGYRAMVATSGTMTMWNAFHGDSSCGGNVTSYVDSYASESASDGVGENWIDEAYSWGIFDDDCPVSIVYGSTSAARESMYQYGGWNDRKSTGTQNASTIYYVAGCYPDKGRKLPG